MKQLIKTKGTEFEFSGGDLAIIDTQNRFGKPIMLKSSELDTAIFNGTQEALDMIEVDSKPSAIDIRTEQLTEDGYAKEVMISGTSDTLAPYLFFRSATNVDGFFNKMEKVTISNNFKKINMRAFWNNNALKEVKLPENLESITNGTFYLCTSLTLKTLPKSVKNINQAFRGCTNLIQMSLPGVETFGDSTSLDWGTFTQCSNLKALWIGSNVKEMGSYDLGYCTNIKKIFIDLPRATVEAFTYYWCTWSCTKLPSYGTYSINNSVVVCNDDEGFMTQEEFDAIDWSTYTG